MVDAIAITILKNRECRQRPGTDISDLHAGKGIGIQSQVTEVGSVPVFRANEGKQGVLCEREPGFFIRLTGKGKNVRLLRKIPLNDSIQRLAPVTKLGAILEIA